MAEIKIEVNEGSCDCCGTEGTLRVYPQYGKDEPVALCVYCENTSSNERREMMTRVLARFMHTLEARLTKKESNGSDSNSQNRG